MTVQRTDHQYRRCMPLACRAATFSSAAAAGQAADNTVTVIYAHYAALVRLAAVLVGHRHQPDVIH